MEFFVMRNEINKILLSFWISFMNLQFGGHRKYCRYGGDKKLNITSK